MTRHAGEWELQIWNGGLWRTLCLICGYERESRFARCTTCSKVNYRRKYLLDVLSEAQEILKTMALTNGGVIFADRELRLLTHLSVGKIPHLCASRSGMRVYHTQTGQQFVAREFIIFSAGISQKPHRNRKGIDQ